MPIRNALKVCAQPNCPTLTATGRCPKHQRPTRQQRGYGQQHLNLRASWQQRIDAGERVVCWRCKVTVIRPGDAWDLGHDDADRDRYRGPECTPCNRATNGR